MQTDLSKPYVSLFGDTGHKQMILHRHIPCGSSMFIGNSNNGQNVRDYVLVINTLFEKTSHL